MSPTPLHLLHYDRIVVPVLHPEPPRLPAQVRAGLPRHRLGHLARQGVPARVHGLPCKPAHIFPSLPADDHAAAAPRTLLTGRDACSLGSCQAATRLCGTREVLRRWAPEHRPCPAGCAAAEARLGSDCAAEGSRRQPCCTHVLQMLSRQPATNMPVIAHAQYNASNAAMLRHPHVERQMVCSLSPLAPHTQQRQTPQLSRPSLLRGARACD